MLAPSTTRPAMNPYAHTPSLKLHALALLAALCTAATPAFATEPAAAKASKPAAVKKAPPKASEAALPAPSPAQVDAAERVYYGVYECEAKQAIDVSISPKHPAYVDLQHGKTRYLMKPVLSSTGAIRLEDVKGQTLLVQIGNKSMLMDVTAGRRIVDDCLHPKQRELIEAAKLAKAAEQPK